VILKKKVPREPSTPDISSREKNKKGKGGGKRISETLQLPEFKKGRQRNINLKQYQVGRKKG